MQLTPSLGRSLSCIVVLGGMGGVAAAAPPHVAAVPARISPPLIRHASAVRGVGAALSGWHHTLTTSSVTAPPFVYAPLRAVIRPAGLPPLRLTSLLPALPFTDCAAPSSTVLLSRLPAAAVIPLGCLRPFPADDAGPPTALSPGRNKNALYGPAYTPQTFAGP